MARPIPDLEELESHELDGDDRIIVQDTSESQTKQMTIADLLSNPNSGWINAAESWSYVSANTIGVPSDATTKYGVGYVIKLTQSTGGTKYGTVIAVTSTSLTVYWRNGATLENEAISDPYFSLNATPFGAGNIEAPQLDFSSIGHGFVEIGKHILTGSANSMSVSNLPTKKHLQVICIMIASGASVSGQLRFNNDSGNNYARRNILDPGTVNTVTSTDQLITTPTIVSGTPAFITADIINLSSAIKICNVQQRFSEANNASTAPSRTETSAKWNNSAQVTRIDMVTSSNNFAAGSSLRIFGKD